MGENTTEKQITKQGKDPLFRAKDGAFRFPVNTISISKNVFERGKNIPNNEHIFCSHCGREITMFHVERCRVVMIDEHMRVLTTDGELLYYCLPYERCMAERKIGILSQGIKSQVKQYLGVKDYEVQDLWKSDGS